ncbi:unnamed protein product [Amoebophrya sp. A120]|nr:unnamed protein product [Amoebophrya sp. A120]|eukprot:GSA120T00003533001.1
MTRRRRGRVLWRPKQDATLVPASAAGCDQPTSLADGEKTTSSSDSFRLSIRNAVTGDYLEALGGEAGKEWDKRHTTLRGIREAIAATVAEIWTNQIASEEVLDGEPGGAMASTRRDPSRLFWENVHLFAADPGGAHGPQSQLQKSEEGGNPCQSCHDNHDNPDAINPASTCSAESSILSGDRHEDGVEPIALHDATDDEIGEKPKERLFDALTSLFSSMRNSVEADGEVVVVPAGSTKAPGQCQRAIRFKIFYFIRIFDAFPNRAELDLALRLWREWHLHRRKVDRINAGQPTRTPLFDLNSIRGKRRAKRLERVRKNFETYGPIRIWDLSNIRDLSNLMSQIFRLAEDFRRNTWHPQSWERYPQTHALLKSKLDVSQWNVKGVKNFSYLFQEHSVCYGRRMLELGFDQDLGAWDVSSAETFRGMFEDCTHFQGRNLHRWNVKNATDFSSMFRKCGRFNENIGEWDLGSATRLDDMFSGCKSFNQDLSKWDVSNVISFSRMFFGCVRFDQDLRDWKVGGGTKNMVLPCRDDKLNNVFITIDGAAYQNFRAVSVFEMFSGCTSFDGDLSNWNVSVVRKFGRMFVPCNSPSLAVQAQKGSVSSGSGAIG